VEDPVEIDRAPTMVVTGIRSVPVPPPAGELEADGLVDSLAAALRAVRGYVPHHIWWEEGPAHALLAYQALHGA
jgi:hypothetical protein